MNDIMVSHTICGRETNDKKNIFEQKYATNYTLSSKVALITCVFLKGRGWDGGY